MKNKRYVRIDKQGRLKLPQDFLEVLDIKTDNKIALTSEKDGMIGVAEWDLEKLQIQKVIAIVSIDSKGRLIFPKELREEVIIVEIFFYDNKIMIKESLD